jgi:hypothetical protein
MRYFSVITLILWLPLGGAVGGTIDFSAATDPKLTASAATFSGIDTGSGIDISSFGASITDATGTATGLTNAGTIDFSFTYDPSNPTSLPSGGLPPPFVSLDPMYLVLSTLVAVNTGPGTIDLLFANDDPGSDGFLDFSDNVLVSVDLAGVTGDPFAHITGLVNSGFGFADFDADIKVSNLTQVPVPSALLLATSGLFLLVLVGTIRTSEITMVAGLVFNVRGRPLRSSR